MSEIVYREVAVTIDKIEIVEGTEGEYRRYGIKVPWSQYPVPVLTRDQELWPHLKAKASVVLILQRGKAKQGKEESSLDRDYWWNIAGIKGIKEPEGYESPVQTEKPASAIPSTGRPSHEDFMAERASIERQTSLKAAVELAGYCLAHGKALTRETALEIMQLTLNFAELIASGKMPALPSQPPAVPVGGPPEATKVEARAETASRKQSPLNGVTHDWQWFCTEVLKIKDMTVMKAMAILEIEKADQWAGTWDEALSKVKAARK